MSKESKLFISLLLISTLVFVLTIGCGDAEGDNSETEPDDLPESMKGYELWSWNEGGTWKYTLITGTNRCKEAEEITTSYDNFEKSPKGARPYHLPQGSASLPICPDRIESITLVRGTTS
jgi:hypothetical protein